MSAEADVRQAHDAFYKKLSAFVSGDTSQLMGAWLQSDAISTGQPVGAWARGLDAVTASWAGMATLTLIGDLEVRDLSIHVHGEMAYTIGVEHATLSFAGKPFAFASPFTNIYKRVDGAWLIIHHHVDHSPALQEMLTA